MSTAPVNPGAPASPVVADPWTTRRLLAWMGQALGGKGIDSPRLCAEILLSHVLGCPRIKLYTEVDRPASAEELSTLRGLVARALRHEPVQYLTGEAWFFGLPLRVDRRVLIPRPCTELIVERVVQEKKGRGTQGRGIEGKTSDLDGVPVTTALDPSSLAPSPLPLRIADICSGSGCIAVALAKNLPGARVIASDLSPDALDVARSNAQRHGVADRVDFRVGDLLVPLAGEELFDIITANPPYIPDHEWDAVEANVKDHEPTLALRGGPDGLACVGPLIDAAPGLLAPGGMLLVEIASCTSAAVLVRAQGHRLLRDAQIVRDLEGHERVLVARRA